MVMQSSSGLSAIPKPGTVVKQEAISSQADHPEFRQRSQWYRFLRESHEMSGGYAPVLDTHRYAADPTTLLTSYIIPHEREDITQYQTRVRAAKPPQFVAEGIAITAGVLSYQAPRRSGHTPVLEEWLRWCTVDGQDWRSVVSTAVVPMLERYGWTGVLLTPPPVSGQTEAQVRAAREQAELPALLASVVTPEAIRAWGTDSLGRLEWVRYVEVVYLAGGPLDGGGQRVRRHWWITKQGWWYVDDLRGSADVEMLSPQRDDPQKIDASASHQGDQARDAYASPSGKTEQKLIVGGAGKWKPDGSPLSRLPLVVWELTNRVSPSHACALAQLDYYRTESELRNLELQTAFSQVWVPMMSDNTDPTQFVRGGASIGSFPMDARHVPLMLSPDPGPFEHFMKRLQDLRNDAYGAWGLRQDLSGGSTGLALSLIQERSTNLYRQHAEALTQGDVRTMSVAAEMLGEELSDDFTAEYPTDFSSLTATAIVENVTLFLAMDPGEEYEVRAKQEAARAVLPQMTEQEHSDAEESLRQRIADKEAEAQEMRDLEIAASEAATEAASKPAMDSGRARGGGGMERLTGEQG
jgi:hypothetical protein